MELEIKGSGSELRKRKKTILPDKIPLLHYRNLTKINVKASKSSILKSFSLCNAVF